MTSTQVKTLEQMMQNPEPVPASNWQLRAVQSEECISYVAWNIESREAIMVDPKREDFPTYREIAGGLAGYRWLGVIDTHTHADHISVAAELARELNAPLVMHEKAPSRRVQLRVSLDTELPAAGGPVVLLTTPGHTHDSVTVIWGPYIFGGDTLLFGDTGRDDLPTGSPEAHYESLQKVKKLAKGSMFLLPGHDNKGGRASSWEAQLKLNSSLTQDRESFIREAAAFATSAPKLLKESLFENFK